MHVLRDINMEIGLSSRTVLKSRAIIRTHTPILDVQCRVFPGSGFHGRMKQRQKHLREGFHLATEGLRNI